MYFNFDSTSKEKEIEKPAQTKSRQNISNFQFSIPSQITLWDVHSNEKKTDAIKYIYIYIHIYR